MPLLFLVSFRIMPLRHLSLDPVFGLSKPSAGLLRCLALPFGLDAELENTRLSNN